MVIDLDVVRDIKAAYERAAPMIAHFSRTISELLDNNRSYPHIRTREDLQ